MIPVLLALACVAQAETPACMKLGLLLEGTTLLASCPADSLRVEQVGDTATVWCECGIL